MCHNTRSCHDEPVRSSEDPAQPKKKSPNESNSLASIAHFRSIRKRLLNWRSTDIAPLSFLLGLNGTIGWGGGLGTWGLELGIGVRVGGVGKGV